jgi:activator of HSP90 ATPase
MSESRSSVVRDPSPTRRQALVGAACAVGGLAAGVATRAAGQSMNESASVGAEALRTNLHQEIDIKATPQRVYDTLLSPQQFAAFSHLPAQISPEVGGAFSMFEGRIVGRNIELLPAQRIVQAWRSATWSPGVYSIVHFELRAQGAHTVVVLDHTGFPEGKAASLDSGWHANYWEPLKKYLEAA